MEAVDNLERFIRLQAPAATQPKKKSRQRHPFFTKVTDQDRTDFCLQLSVMLQARISLHRVLQILEEQTKKEAMKSVLRAISQEVQKGNSFANALALQPAVFDNLFVVTAEVGQESGRLPQVMSNLALHLEKIGNLKRKFVQALVYPALVLSVAIGAVLFLLLFIVPTFAEMFRSFQVELPVSTRIILRISGWLTSYALYLIGSVAALGIIFRETLRSNALKEKMETYIFRIPFFGDLLMRNLVARFCRTLGTLLQAQVTLVDALGVTQRIFTSADIKEEITKIIHHVKQGKTIAEPIVESTIFPPMVAQMIAVGEETSELDVMLLKVAEYYEQEIDTTIETLSTVIEPVIILFLGAVVSAILIAMYMPMFDLMNVVGGN